MVNGVIVEEAGCWRTMALRRETCTFGVGELPMSAMNGRQPDAVTRCRGKWFGMALVIVNIERLMSRRSARELIGYAIDSHYRHIEEE